MISSCRYKGISYVKFVISWTVLLLILIGGYFGYQLYLNTSTKISKSESSANKESVDKNQSDEKKDSSGIKQEEDSFGIVDESKAVNSKMTEKDSLIKQKSQRTPEDKTDNFNILILGIDRRSGSQVNWRTDVIQLITLNKERTKAVVTHIPRDIWSGLYKINAIYNLKGPDGIKDEIQKITGQRPDRIIRVDFDAFVYAVDAVGGVNIYNPVEFTDDQYPNDREGESGVISIKFPKGEQSMDGETALQYARSRKGANGEGSDYARGRRQQVLMYAVVKSFFEEENMFKPKTAETLYQIATKKVYTDVSLKDTQVLFDVLKNYKNIKVENWGLDTTNYLMVPNDKSSYGGQWVLVSKSDSYDDVKSNIIKLLNQ